MNEILTRIREAVEEFVKRHSKIELFLFVVIFLYSCWLMFSTFGYKDGEILISSRIWSDFLSHLPLIRSFSMGQNFPPEYPLFPGYPIIYHFGFYLFVGLLERTGMRIDIALNILSSIGFAGLLYSIFFNSKEDNQILGSRYFVYISSNF
jgi:hypothetical protein